MKKLTLTLAMAFTMALAGPAPGDLAADIDAAIRSPRLVGATISVSVRDAASGSALVAINADEPMLPASNMKLFTTGAALHVLGADYDFKTRLMRDGDRLIVVGDGDPAFGDPELLSLMNLDGREGIDVETFLALWTDAVRSSDMTQVRELVVDDRVFDREAVHPTWPADQLERAYCAQVSGLNFHLNILHLYPRPSGTQRPDISRQIPRTPWLPVSNRATSRRSGDAQSNAWLGRRIGANELTVHGNVKHAYRRPLTVTVHDPADFFAALLANRLETVGIPVGGHRLATPEDPAGAGELLGPIISTPISTVVTRANRDSENLYAEALIKRLGHEISRQSGSWKSGGAVIRHVIHERLGADSTVQVIVADGSGLSRDNRVTAALTTAWLDSLQEDNRLGATFVDSLAVAGRNGTLKRRFDRTELHGARVQGKSGYINGVSCLSGYVTTPDGRRRMFSVLANDLKPKDILRAKRLQERIVALVAEDMIPAGVTLGSD